MYLNHVPGGAVLGSCTWPTCLHQGQRGDRVDRACRRPCKAGLLSTPSSEGERFLSLPLFMPVVLEKDGPFVLRLVIKSSPVKIGHAGLSEAAGSQEPSNVQNIWYIHLPDWVVLLLSKCLRTSFFALLESSAELFDNIRKYHVSLWCTLCSAFCFSVKCLFGRR